MGIRREIAEEINRFIDKPERYSFFTLGASHQEIHDQSKKWLRDLRNAEAYSRWGEEGLCALKLHLLVDYITNFLWKPENIERAIKFKEEMEANIGLLGTIRDNSTSAQPMPVSAWIKKVSEHPAPRTVYWCAPKNLFKPEVGGRIEVSPEDTAESLRGKIEEQMRVLKIERWQEGDRQLGPWHWLASYASELKIFPEDVKKVLVELKNLKLAGHKLI